MAPRLPLNITDFAKFVPSDEVPEGYAFVDNTSLIYDLVQEPTHLFLARPRRFGKSLLVSTLAELFRGHHRAFKGTWIHDRWDWDREPRPLLHLSLGLRNIHNPVQLQYELSTYLWDLAGEHAPEIFAGKYEMHDQARRFLVHPASLLRTYLEWMYQSRAGNSDGAVVVLVDEYDIPINENLDSPHATEIVDVMRAFYGAIKDMGNRVHFALVTGVARFARTGLFSGANQLTDISLRPHFGTLLGIPHSALQEAGPWRWHVQQAASNMQEDAEALCCSLEAHYNGYRFAPGSPLVYNPWSLLQCLNEMQQPDDAGPLNLDHLHNYWVDTGNTSLLERILTRSVKSYALPALAGNQISAPSNLDVSAIVRVSYDIQKPDFTALLYQTGYLTHGTRLDEQGNQEVCLTFPNREIAQTFCGPFQDWLRGHLPDTNTLDAWPDIESQVAIWRQIWLTGTLEELFQAGNQFLRMIPYPLYPGRDRVTILDQEFFYQALLYSWISVLGLHPVSEIATHHGRADLVVATQERIWILELKVSGSAEDAVRQILLRGYPDMCADRAQPVTAVGMQIDTLHRQIAACAQWHLGTFDRQTDRWEREPFAAPLASVRLQSDDQLPAWPFRDSLETAAPTHPSDPSLHWPP